MAWEPGNSGWEGVGKYRTRFAPRGFPERVSSGCGVGWALGFETQCTCTLNKCEQKLPNSVDLSGHPFKSVSGRGPGRGDTCHLTDFDETRPVWRVHYKTLIAKAVHFLNVSGGKLDHPPCFVSRPQNGTDVLPLPARPLCVLWQFKTLVSSHQDNFLWISACNWLPMWPDLQKLIIFNLDYLPFANSFRFGSCIYVENYLYISRKFENIFGPINIFGAGTIRRTPLIICKWDVCKLIARLIPHDVMEILQVWWKITYKKSVDPPKKVRPTESDQSSTRRISGPFMKMLCIYLRSLPKQLALDTTSDHATCKATGDQLSPATTLSGPVPQAR